MTDRDSLFDYLRLKLEDAGFQFEKKQKPFMQPKRGWEYKFIHPQLVKKMREKHKVRGEKFYIKQLSDEHNGEIGLVNGKLSPLKEDFFCSPPNSVDTFDKSPAWVNNSYNRALDNLLKRIKEYLEPNGYSQPGFSGCQKLG